MKKKALSLLLVLAMCLSLLPSAALAGDDALVSEQETELVPAQEEEPGAPEKPDEEDGIRLFSTKGGHNDSHPVCGASCSDSDHALPAGTTWQAITTVSELRNATAGYYYLANDITLPGSTGITAWSPKDGIVLCLNGKSITVENSQQPTINVGVLDSSDPINFTLTDCHTGSEQGKITRAASGVGPGVQVLPNSTFTMYGGHLVDNGCGVALAGGTFNMYGGTISNSTVYGGVRATYSINNRTNTYVGGTFNMYDGSITGNTSNYGGGVFVDSDSSRSVAAAFYMYGGSITGNTANTLGYGTGGGVYVNAGATFEVSGDVTITGNTKDGATSNVYLPTGATMTVGALDTNASIGVTMVDGSTVTGVSSESIGSLTSDDDQYEFDLDNNGNLVQKEKPAAHTHYLCGGTTCTEIGHTQETAQTTFAAALTQNAAGDLLQDGTVVPLDTENSSYTLVAGNYYLGENLNLAYPIYITSGTVNLCLNGHELKLTQGYTAACDIITLKDSAILNLTDCAPDGNVGAVTHGSDKYGRGVQIYSTNSTFNLYGGKITGNNAVGNNGGGVNVYGTFNMYGGSITRNSASGYDGGGVYVYDYRTFYMYGGTISDNTAENGGGVYAENSATFTMSGSSAISNNTATSDKVYDTGDGGGVYMLGSFTMSGDSTISGNHASGYGGGVCVASTIYASSNQDGTFTMKGGTITDNTAGYAGGGVFASQDFTMEGGTISKNEASSSGGGGVYIRGDLTMKNGTITGNIAKTDDGIGGGVYTGGDFTMENGEISNNTAEGYHSYGYTYGAGGGVFACGQFTMGNGTISGNQATYGIRLPGFGGDNGGGVFVDDGDFTMTGGTITGNSAGPCASGGGVCVYRNSSVGHYGSTYFTMTGGTITGNSAGASGGGVWTNCSSAYISGSARITGNVKGGTLDTATGLYTGDTASNFLYPDEHDPLPLEIVRDAEGSNGLAADARIGISVPDLPFAGDSTKAVVTNAKESDLQYFFDDAGEPYELQYVAGEEGSNGTIVLTRLETHDHYLCCEDNCTGIGHTESAQTHFDRELTSSNGKLLVNGAELSVTQGTIGSGSSTMDVYDLAAGNYYLGGNLDLSTPLYITSGEVKLCLNGYSIKLTQGDKIYVITTKDKGSLTLTDCYTGTEENRLAQITHGSDATGGGVLVDNSHSFKMYGGNITGNSYNGGVNVPKNGDFYMYGGKITGNASSGDGGGARIIDGDFHMYGGEIRDNTAGTDGGGVYLEYNTMFLSGASMITGNKGRSGKVNNLHLGANSSIKICGALTGAIGVTVPSFKQPTVASPTMIAYDAGNYPDSVKCVTSDNPDYTVKIDSQVPSHWVLTVAKVIAPTAIANLTYNGTSQTGVASGAGYTLSGTVTATDAGTYEATATLDSGYVWSDGTAEPKTISWSIAKKVPTASDFNITIPADSTYDGTVRQLDISLKEGLTGCDYKVVVSTGGQPTSEIKNAGLYLFRIEVTEGGNFKAGTLRDSTWSFTIEKAQFDITATGYTGVYDGQAHSITVTVNNNPNAVIRYNTKDSAVSGPYEEWGYDSLSYTDAGEYTVYYRVSADNYEYTGGSAKIIITQAEPTLPAGLTGMKGQTLSAVQLPEGWTWADPSTVMSATGDQRFSANYAGSKNYSAKNNVELTVTVTEKSDAKVTFAETVPATKTYGDADFSIVAVAGVQSTNGTWTWASGDETVLQVTGSGSSATIKILKASAAPVTITAKYESDGTLGQITANITVNKATVTVTAASKSAYVGDPVPALPAAPVLGTDYTVTGLVNGDTLSGTIVLAYASEPDMTKPGTTAITLSGVVVSDNYILRTVDGVLTVSAKSSPSGGGSSVPTYPVNTPETVENGKISSNWKRAAKGSTVTITVTPDSGCTLAELVVTDKDGNVLPLTDKGDGKYSFTMPVGAVDVRADFTRDAASLPFADVPSDAYYAEAVRWAAENGITSGTGNGLFGPENACTRAEIVTFLWRAAGSPAAASTVIFSDVPADSYYATAVAWAVENGITVGTGNGKFSPDAICTRAQAVTFLFRAAKATATGRTAFVDVDDDAYYALAVKWAVDNGITQGVGSNRFAPDQICTRAQIVTFLFRANHQ